MEPSTAIVLAGGDLGNEETLDLGHVPSPATVIAADSGYEMARRLGLDVDLLVGDLDSISPSALASARASGIPIEVHPADKDATDLELALRAATALEPDEIVIIGGFGGRFDHLLSNALLLAAGFLGDVPVRWEGRTVTAHRVTAAHGCVISGRHDDLVSLLPIGEPATGIATEGLRWRLQGETLRTGSTRGMSNRMSEERAAVSVDAGVLLVIHTRGERP